MKFDSRRAFVLDRQNRREKDIFIPAYTTGSDRNKSIQAKQKTWFKKNIYQCKSFSFPSSPKFRKLEVLLFCQPSLLKNQMRNNFGQIVRIY